MDENLQGTCAVPGCSDIGCHQMRIGVSKVLVCERHHDRAYALCVAYQHGLVDLRAKFHRLFRELKGETDEEK
jgi:hypothetical protein